MSARDTRGEVTESSKQDTWQARRRKRDRTGQRRSKTKIKTLPVDAVPVESRRRRVLVVSGACPRSHASVGELAGRLSRLVGK